MEVATIRKALVPVGVAAVLAVLAKLGVGADMTVKEAVTLLITSGLVFLIPNRQKK